MKNRVKQAIMPFQSGNITVELPGNADILKMAGGTALRNCGEEIEKALAEPIGTPPFAEIVRKKVEAKKSESGAASGTGNNTSVPDGNSNSSRSTSVPHDNNSSVPHEHQPE